MKKDYKILLESSGQKVISAINLKVLTKLNFLPAEKIYSYKP